MWPTLYDPPGEFPPMRTYGLAVLFAFALAFLYVHTQARRLGVQPDRLIPGYIAAGIGGLLGAWGLDYVIVAPLRFIFGASMIAEGGLTFYFGVVGGAVATITVLALMKLPVLKLTDIAAPSVALGQGIGRIGCFFAGCCHGAELPADPRAVALLPDHLLEGQIYVQPSFPFLTTVFDGGVGRLLHVPLYPTQLWSVVAGLALFAGAAALVPYRRFDGQIAALLLLVEPVFRIAIELYRADARGYVLWTHVSPAVAAWLPGMGSAGSEVGDAVVGITTSQAIALGMMAGGAALWLWRYRYGKAPETPLPEE